MKRIALLSILASLILTAGRVPARAGEVGPRDDLFQVSTLGALMEGVYDGVATLEEIGRHGDHGLGTYEALDGEMVLLDGVFYQVAADGVARPMERSTRSPFATVTFFDRDRVETIDRELTCAEMQEAIDRMLPTRNLPWAIRIEGAFAYMKTRSVPKQEKPYRKLTEVAATQPTFESTDVEGTFVGFRLPSFLERANLPGYHFHFLDAEKKRGGHVLECRVKKATIALDATADVHLALPPEGDFVEVDLSGKAPEVARKVEAGK